MTERPNFLYIITDQHRADYLGCSGHPVVQTPSIDSIAAKGRLFNRFYVANPVCQPNRSTLMTGRMPSLHGVRNNGSPLPLRSNTFVDALRAGGYSTALIGKSHIQNMTPYPPIMTRPEPRDGFTALSDEFAEAMKPVPGEGPYDQEHPDRWRPAKYYDLTLPFYGYEHVDLCTEHSDQVGGHYYAWFKERRPDADDLRNRDNQLPHDYVCPQAYRTPIPEELYPTSYIKEKSLEWLDNHAGGASGKPFFAMVSFPDPHHPFTPPGKYWDMYKPEDMALPPSFDLGNREPAPQVKWAMEARASGDAVVNSQNAFSVNERETLEAMALSCGMITMIDNAIGEILAKLDALGLADNTVIVFNSDHGDFMGDHRLMLKGPAHFQGLVRVPFIWSDPDGSAKGTTDTLAGTVDVAATILERAKIEPYNGIQGRSLLAAARGESGDKEDGNAPDCMIVEDDQQRQYLGFDNLPRLRTIITDDWRMTISRGNEWGELYNLADDPHEMQNLWDDPGGAAAKARLMEQLAYKQMELVDRSPLPTGRA